MRGTCSAFVPTLADWTPSLNTGSEPLVDASARSTAGSGAAARLASPSRRPATSQRFMAVDGRAAVLFGLKLEQDWAWR